MSAAEISALASAIVAVVTAVGTLIGLIVHRSEPPSVAHAPESPAK